MSAASNLSGSLRLLEAYRRLNNIVYIVFYKIDDI